MAAPAGKMPAGVLLFNQVEDFLHRFPDMDSGAVHVLGIHPVVVEVGVAGLGDLEVSEKGGVAKFGSQALRGISAVGVFGVAPVALSAEGFEGVADGAPEFFGGLEEVAGHEFPVGVVQEFAGDAGVVGDLGVGGWGDGGCHNGELRAELTCGWEVAVSIILGDCMPNYAKRYGDEL